jgi:DNA-binding NarL/FixJ family response regulator
MTGTSAPGAVRRTRVAVIEEHEILRFGLVACLSEDPRLEVVATAPEAVGRHDVDIAVVSSASARAHRFPCPIVIYGDVTQDPDSARAGNDVAGALNRDSLTVAQLHATLQAAATGLRVNSDHPAPVAPSLASRELQLLELIADGHSTREIAERMSYSERTIKKLITGLESRLGARSRPHIVAQAIRRGLI